ncbi:GNAT family N-acetyltransferase [Streptomyces rochei]|uniref:GNAT family N-acetyltransferase n=1 Tax=Streptomyces rochei TaxID=1928 RepID=UPI00368BA9BB
MSEPHVPTWSWETGRDPDEIHALLCACDAARAAQTGSPVPQRSPATTRLRVQEGSVHVLRRDGRLAATFTITRRAPFTCNDALPAAHRPAYLGRLAVDPLWLGEGSIVGAQCIRRAVEVAQEAGADAVRAEANPDLTETMKLLKLLGFRQYGPDVVDDGGFRRAQLQMKLTG